MKKKTNKLIIKAKNKNKLGNNFIGRLSILK